MQEHPARGHHGLMLNAVTQVTHVRLALSTPASISRSAFAKAISRKHQHLRGGTRGMYEVCASRSPLLADIIASECTGH